jgi:hypothetical protein
VIAALCLAAIAAPALLIVWMPIVFGVPHVGNDLRLLVVPLPRWPRAVAVIACGMLVALRVVAVATGVVLVRAEAAVVAGWLLAMVSLAPTTRVRFAAVAACAVAVVALPVTFATVAAFAHNLVAVVAWIVIARPGRRRAVATIAALAGALALAMLVGPHAAGQGAFLDKAAQTVFPGLPHGRALIIGFTLLQAMHYAMWLVYMPRRRPHALFLAGGIAVIAAGLVNATWARATYLSLATFHVYLELVVLGARLARRPR